MGSELLSQRKCLTHLIPQTFGMLKQGKLTADLSLKQHLKKLFVKIIRKQIIVISRLMTI